MHLTSTHTLGRVSLLAALSACVFLSACAKDEGGGGGGGGGEPCVIVATVPNFAAAVFTNPTTIDNTFLPLTPGDANVYRLVEDGEIETTVFEVLSTTNVVNGVTCVEVHDTVYLEDLLIEDTTDWYAQDDAGNVWYFGEAVLNYEYDDNDVLIGTNTDGSWEAGLDIAATGTNAIAGIAMLAAPAVGNTYYQEYYLTEAEDLAEVIALAVPITLADGRMFTCLQTLECNPLELDSHEYKFYAPGIGLVREESLDSGLFTEQKARFLVGAGNAPSFGAAVFTTPLVINNPFFTLTPGNSYTYRAATEDGIETIVVDVTAQTRVVNGVTTRIVHDRVYLDGRLIEDTFDWYAQDNAGNVWYFGEDVVDYFYDATGALTGTSTAGSWEAGVGGALPGINMLATPAAGDAYEQEFWAGQAEDVAMVLATGLTVTLGNGTVYTGCIQTIDWNPLNPTPIESKFFAPGAGPGIREIEIDGVEVIDLTLTTP